MFLLLLEVLYTRQLYIEQVDLLGVLQRNSRGESMICKDSRANQTVDEDVTFTHVIPITGHGGIRHCKNSGSQIWLSGQKMVQKQGIQHEHMGQ